MIVAKVLTERQDGTFRLESLRDHTDVPDHLYEDQKKFVILFKDTLYNYIQPGMQAP